MKLKQGLIILSVATGLLVLVAVYLLPKDGTVSNSNMAASGSPLFNYSNFRHEGDFATFTSAHHDHRSHTHVSHNAGHYSNNITTNTSWSVPPLPQLHIDGVTFITGSVDCLAFDIAKTLEAEGKAVSFFDDFIHPSFGLTRGRQETIDKLRHTKQRPIDHKQSIVQRLKTVENVKTILYVPHMSLSMDVNTRTMGVAHYGKLLVNFIKLLDHFNSDNELRFVLLLTVDGDYIQESLLELFSLILNSHQSSHGLDVTVITVEEGFSKERCTNFNELIYYIYSNDRHSNDGVLLGCKKKEVVLSGSTIKRQNVLFSTYFTKNKEFVRPYRENSFQFVKGFVITAKKHNARIVIYYDQIDSGYKERLLQYYSNIEFIHYTGNFHRRTINDARFYIMYEYLQDHPEVDHIILQDLRDGLFLTDPFKVMELAGDYLYVGMDVSFRFGFPKWYRHCEKKLKQKYPHLNRTYPFLNAGTMGGTRHVVLAFLKQIIKSFEDIFPARLNCNMDAFDFVSHYVFQDVMFTGYPFQGFMQLKLTSPPGIAIRHKRTKFDM